MVKEEKQSKGCFFCIFCVHCQILAVWSSTFAAENEKQLFFSLQQCCFVCNFLQNAKRFAYVRIILYLCAIFRAEG